MRLVSEYAGQLLRRTKAILFDFYDFYGRSDVDDRRPLRGKASADSYAAGNGGSRAVRRNPERNDISCRRLELTYFYAFTGQYLSLCKLGVRRNSYVNAIRHFTYAALLIYIYALS